MITVRNDFEKRVSEIESYFSLVEALIEKDGIIFFDNKRTHKYKTVDSELKKVMKANVFLLLYNLMESTVRQMLVEVYDKISSDNLKFIDVTDNIQRIWIKRKYKNFKDKGAGFIHGIINSINDDIIIIEFDIKDISGNIDSRKIKDFSDEIGFSSRVHYTLNNGDKLHQVKTNRNKLAHGEISFSECGRLYTVPDMKTIKKQVIKYLRKIIDNTEIFLNNQDYKG